MFRNLCTRLQRIEIQMLRENGRGHKRRETSPYFNPPHMSLGRGKNEHPEKSIQEENGRYFVYPSHHTKNFLRDKQNLGIFHKYNIGEEEGPSFNTSALLPVLSRVPLYTPHRTAEMRFPSPPSLSGEVLSDLFVAAPSSSPPLIAI